MQMVKFVVTHSSHQFLLFICSPDKQGIESMSTFICLWWFVKGDSLRSLIDAVPLITVESSSDSLDDVCDSLVAVKSPSMLT